MSRRLLIHNKLLSKSLLQKNDAILGLACKLYFARGKQNDTNDEPFKVSKLFQPGAAKIGSDTELGVELTGKIDKSDILRVLNKFTQKQTNRDLCKEYGLDGIAE